MLTAGVPCHMLRRTPRCVAQPTRDTINLKHDGWHYNPHLKRWEMTHQGWRASVARWANGSEWTAAIERAGIATAQRVAAHLFSWQDDAQAWCITAILQARQISDEAAQ